MSTSPFRAFIDDAALFPPGNAPMPDALRAHADFATTWYADLVGPFLCPASRLGELQQTLGDQPPLDLILIGDTGVAGVLEAADAVRADARLVLRGAEVPVPAADPVGAARRTATGLRALEPDLATSIEVPRGPGLDQVLDIVAEEGLRAKLRTGGATTDAIPSEVELAEFLAACLDRELAFKLTAGLHHAVRQLDPATGLEQHGFVNVLAATAATLDGASVPDVVRLLQTTDPQPLLDTIDPAGIDRARQWFQSFGSCSITEPLDELVALGLLRQPEVAP